jgi:hypothetical protein
MQYTMSRTELLAAIEQQLDHLPDTALLHVLQVIGQLSTQAAEQQSLDLQRIFTEDATLLHRLAQ